MAGVPGISFPAASFRKAIQMVYTMGAPVEADQQVTFHFDPIVTITGATDSEGIPFDLAASRQEIIPPPVSVTCGVDAAGGGGEGDTPFGEIVQSRVTVYLLDVDYAQVKDAAYIMLGGERYDYFRTEQPGALFDVGMYTMIFRAENDR